MKKQAALLFTVILAANFLSSCADNKPEQDVGSTILDIIETPTEEIKTIEYSVEYRHDDTGLTAYATGTLEQNEPLSYRFIADTLAVVSELPVTILDVSPENPSEEGGDTVTIDLDREFFYSDKNDEATERSFLNSLYRNLVGQYPTIEETRFTLNGESFVSPYRTLPDAPFTLLEKPETFSVSYTLSYYDVIEDTTKTYTETADFWGTVKPEYFIEKLTELTGYPIRVNGIAVEDGCMTVDFDAACPPITGIGSYETGRVFESIRDVMFDVFPDIDAIAYAADGKAYDDGHLTISPDTPYAVRKHHE